MILEEWMRWQMGTARVWATQVRQGHSQWVKNEAGKATMRVMIMLFPSGKEV